MDQQTLLFVMAAFVAVAAIALVIQAGLLFGMYKATRAMEQNAARLVPKVEALMPKLEALVDTSKSAVDESRRMLGDVTTRTNDILDATRKQLVRVDELFEDVSGRARVQLDRAELVLDDAMTRTQETVAIVQSGILKPIREIHGVATGVRAAINFLMRGRRTDPAHFTADEEMFI